MQGSISQNNPESLETVVSSTAVEKKNEEGEQERDAESPTLDAKPQIESNDVQKEVRQFKLFVCINMVECM